TLILFYLHYCRQWENRKKSSEHDWASPGVTGHHTQSGLKAQLNIFIFLLHHIHIHKILFRTCSKFIISLIVVIITVFNNSSIIFEREVCTKFLLMRF
ncbi:hypothetical protein, partial [Bacteroides sp. 519]|uniref:hypothetical protein n=1 Tax=Bacteroides sp. 519 TaxID=2302937 RepID=UPI0019402323